MRGTRLENKTRSKLKLTKYLPLETSHPLISELNEDAVENIENYEVINFKIQQAMKIIKTKQVITKGV